MTVRRGEEGHGSMLLLCMMFLVLASTAALTRLFDLWTRAAAGEADNNARISRIEAITAEIIAALVSDPTPDTNSAGDPIWGWNKKTVGDLGITVSPVSDRLNLNFVRKNILEATRLSSLFAPDKGADDLQQFREDRGFSLFTTEYLPFFPTEDIDLYFSCYGWANINLTDEFAARKLARHLTGSDTSAENLRAVIQKLIIGQELCLPAQLERTLGHDYEKLFPWFNAEPLININFAEPSLIRELVSYREYGIDQVSSRLEEILRLREAGGIHAEAIPPLLGLDPGKGHPLTQYLGAVTWFWELIFAEGEKKYRVVLCRLPEKNSSPKPSYRIIERRLL